MKQQALFSWKDKSKKLKCRLLRLLFDGLRVNKKIMIVNGKRKRKQTTY